MDNNDRYNSDVAISTIESDVSKTPLTNRESEKCCTMDTVRKRIPILQWLPNYSLSYLGQDFLAGLTVGLTAIPQGIAYATVADIPAEYGLYSGVMGCFVYMIFGTSKDINIGPTAIMSLMIQSYTGKFGPDIAVLLCFLSGCVIFLFGLLHLGFLVQFISYPVTAGFTSAAAISIGSTQIKSLLGIKGQANQFIESWETVFNNLDKIKTADATLGGCSIIVLLFLRFLRTFGHRQSNPSKTHFQNIIAKVLWLLGLASNALVVSIGAFIAWQFSLHGKEPFELTAEVEKGLPSFHLPPFTAHHDNNTYTFTEMIEEVEISLLTIPIIAILESVAIAKNFAIGSLDATQEMIALGLSNICGSFIGSMPTTGSFTRTAVNHASGVQTTLGGIFTAILVLLSLGFLTSTFSFIPKATLAAVIITAMIFMLEAHAVVLLWKTKKMDLAIYIITVLSCLFTSLEIGILIGIGINTVWILYGAARPNISIEYVMVSNKRVMLVTPSQSLLFPSAEYLREIIVAELDYMKNYSSISNTQNNGENNLVIVLDGRNVLYIDTTVAKNLKTLVEHLEKQKQRIIFWRWSRAAEEVCRGLDFKLSGLFINVATLELAIGDWESDFGNNTNNIPNSICSM
ncbi:sodium-independent sulfate anion transporter-like [Chrysoperla carnea]|uniref:sodium-independent sulfate anion transporter-like n=1 Tax=Chrysoperla carnea TaxID=189513 RepID=UPI001D07A7CE|nr:sodium-independent sulfate anion transporter-like [Chrysoperla carnea]